MSVGTCDAALEKLCVKLSDTYTDAVALRGVLDRLLEDLHALDLSLLLQLGKVD